MLRIKRIYEDADAQDGYRILVDRLWPRGISKERAKINLWSKEISPSNTLRIQFDHDENRFDEFKRAYLGELESKDFPQKFLYLVEEKLSSGNVTLLYAAKGTEKNNAAVLRDWLLENTSR